MLAPLAGAALDRVGPQVMGLVASLGLASALVLLSHARTITSFGLSICLMRFSGPECMMILGNTTVNRWFVRRRGRATVIRSFSEAGLLAFPALVNSTIGHLGWRATLRLLSVAVVVLGAAACAVLRRDPESLSLLPDGDVDTKKRDLQETANTLLPQHGTEARAAAPRTREPAWEFTDVVRDPFFWALCVASGLFNLFWAGVNLHSVDIFGSNGVEKAHVAALTVRRPTHLVHA